MFANGKVAQRGYCRPALYFPMAAARIGSAAVEFDTQTTARSDKSKADPVFHRCRKQFRKGLRKQFRKGFRIGLRKQFRIGCRKGFRIGFNYCTALIALH